MDKNDIVEMITNKIATILNTVRSRRCQSCCIILNPGDKVHEIDCYRVDAKLKRHPLATRYICEFCYTDEELSKSIDSKPKEDNKPLVPEPEFEEVSFENTIEKKDSFIDNIINWFKNWFK